jgi:hypothetical protein
MVWLLVLGIQIQIKASDKYEYDKGTDPLDPNVYPDHDYDGDGVLDEYDIDPLNNVMLTIIINKTTLMKTNFEFGSNVKIIYNVFNISYNNNWSEEVPSRNDQIVVDINDNKTITEHLLRLNGRTKIEFKVGYILKSNLEDIDMGTAGPDGNDYIIHYEVDNFKYDQYCNGDIGNNDGIPVTVQYSIEHNAEI